MSKAVLRIISIETSLVPRLTLALCELVEGRARAGMALQTPKGGRIAPIFAQDETSGASTQSLTLVDNVASRELAADDLLKSLD